VSVPCYDTPAHVPIAGRSNANPAPVGCYIGEGTQQMINGLPSPSLAPFLSSVDRTDATGNTDIGNAGRAWTASGCNPNLIRNWTTGKPSPVGAEEHCQPHADDRNNGSLTSS